MFKDEICKLANRILHGMIRELHCDLMMNARRAVNRVCHIHSLVSWITLWCKNKAGLLQDNSNHYFQCQNLWRQKVNMYQSMHGVHHHWQHGILERSIMAARERKEQVRIQRTNKHKRAHFLVNTGGRDKSIHWKPINEKNTRPGELGEGGRLGKSEHWLKASKQGTLTLWKG